MQSSANRLGGALTFAHLSDPHLSSLNLVRWRYLANKRLLGYLSWRRKRRFEHRHEVLQALRQDLTKTLPDHLIITGDLTHIGLPDEFLQVRRWLESMGAPDDITIVPGNHDAYVRVAWQHSFAHWQAYMNSDNRGEDTGQSRAGQAFPSLRIRGPVAFIGLSSAHVSAPFMATGSLGKAQLSQLSELLDKTAQQGLFRVVLLHHPPQPGAETWRKRLTDAPAMCEVLADCGAELVLHGHSHRYRQSKIARPGNSVPVFGIPSASSIGPNPRRAAKYQIYKVQKVGNEWKLDMSLRAYLPHEGRFVKEQDQSMLLPAANPTTTA